MPSPTSLMKFQSRRVTMQLTRVELIVPSSGCCKDETLKALQKNRRVMKSAVKRCPL